MDKERLKILKEMKKKYKNLIEIKYIVGSFARGDFNKNSDIDIVYSLRKDILEREDVFKIFNNLSKLKQELQNKLNIKVDLIDESTLSSIAKKYMKEKIDV